MEDQDKCYNIICNQNDPSFPQACKLYDTESIGMCDALTLSPCDINRWFECQNKITHLKNMLAAGERTIQAGSDFDLLVERLG